MTEKTATQRADVVYCTEEVGTMAANPHVVFMGTPEFAVPALEALIRANYHVAGVLTREDHSAGRGRRIEESPVKQVARAASLPVLQPRTLRDPGALHALAALDPEVIVVAAYGLILPPAVLDLPPGGCINIHGSLLPRHRGAAPIAAALLSGDVETGVSIMVMDAGVDTGPVLSRAAIPIGPEDTTGTLTTRLAALGADLLLDTLPRWLVGEISPAQQPLDGASYAPRIGKADGLIRWDEPATMIARRIRAYEPWPSAYTFWGEQMLKVLRGTADESFGGGEAGDGQLAAGVVIARGRESAGVVTGNGVLWLREVQVAGKKPLLIEAFLRGAPGFVGSRLR